jgi:type II secretory pathway pseudopilin PulG
MTRRSSTVARHTFGQNGITVLELLIMVVVVGVVAAIGVPFLHGRSKSAVLDANLQSLAAIVQEEALEGYSWDYRPDSDGDDDTDTNLSSHLETLLGESVGKSRYVNPCVPGRTARTIVNSTSIATGPETLPPAVFLTNSAECRYAAFETQPYDTVRRYLTGSIIVQFDTEAGNVDVFFVDAGGNKSARVIHVPMA